MCPLAVLVSGPLTQLLNWQVEQKPGGRGRGRGRGRKWATLGVHPLSGLRNNNRLEKVPFVSVPHTSSNRLLLSNQDKGCTPSVAHSLALPLGPALLNLWIDIMEKHTDFIQLLIHRPVKSTLYFRRGCAKAFKTNSNWCKGNMLQTLNKKKQMMLNLSNAEVF